MGEGKQTAGLGNGELEGKEYKRRVLRIAIENINLSGEIQEVWFRVGETLVSTFNRFLRVLYI